MSKYIDAEHFRRWVIARWEERDITNPYPLSGREILDQIEREEYFTADVAEVKHGRWEDPEDLTCYKCSVCGEYATQEYGLTEPIFWRFCPNCGALMDE